MRFRPSMNWLLVFLPAAVVLEHRETAPAMVYLLPQG
jgi:hypothetical protein